MLSDGTQLTSSSEISMQWSEAACWLQVATGGEARWRMPMLILVPRITGVPGQSILGFGDVVLPGESIRPSV